MFKPSLKRSFPRYRHETRRYDKPLRHTSREQKHPRQHIAGAVGRKQPDLANMERKIESWLEAAMAFNIRRRHQPPRETTAAQQPNQRLRSTATLPTRDPYDTCVASVNYLIDAEVRVGATQQGQRRLGQARILLIEIYQMRGICGGW